MTGVQFLAELDRRIAAKDRAGIVSLCDEHLDAARSYLTDEQYEGIVGGTLRSAAIAIEAERRYRQAREKAAA